MTTQEKIKQSFEQEFNQTAEVITLDQRNAFVISENKSFWCVLTSKGVKKNSWRIEW
jgi:hypothetical protein